MSQLSVDVFACTFVPVQKQSEGDVAQQLSSADGMQANGINGKGGKDLQKLQPEETTIPHMMSVSGSGGRRV